MSVAAVVFDFDLTLVDSVRAVSECASFALRALGLPAAPVGAVHRAIGLPLPELFRRVTGQADPRLADEFARRYRERAERPEITRSMRALLLRLVCAS